MLQAVKPAMSARFFRSGSRQAAFEHGDGSGLTPDESRARECPRLPLKLPGLGGQRLKLPARSRRDGSCTRHGRKAEQAYRRSDALENRRKLMEAWAAYCDPKISNKVVQIGKRNKPVAPPVSARPTRPFASAAMSEEDTLYDDRTTRI
jgi:hypothetical protein